VSVDVAALDGVEREVSTRADWRRCISLYRHLAEIAQGRGPLPDDVPSGLAEALAKTFAAYEGNESGFIDDLFAVWSAIDGLCGSEAERFRALYKAESLDRFEVYRNAADRRRRPKPFEAAVETVRRIVDLNVIRERLVDLPTTAILGGSLSYGRFFNTCGGQQRPSDIDLLLVLPDYRDLPAVADALGRVTFIDPASVAEMRTRVGAFEVQRLARRVVFSQKLRLWETRPSEYVQRFQVPAGHYLLALHVFDLSDFAALVMKSTPRIPSDLHLEIAEFRGDQPNSATEELRSFLGVGRHEALRCEVVRGGFIATHVAARVVEDRFYPGSHLNIVLPRFEVRWESPQARLRLTLLALRWKLVARLHDEERLHGETPHLSYAHVRSDAFSPHVQRRLVAEESY
jgi:hypothetical protein